LGIIRKNNLQNKNKFPPKRHSKILFFLRVKGLLIVFVGEWYNYIWHI
jgi:hypothetical protein